jgi:hypothetical protein
MPTSTRTTSLGACAACGGGYGLSGHLSTCESTRQPAKGAQLELSVQARPTSENILALLRYEGVRGDEGSGDF